MGGGKWCGKKARERERERRNEDDDINDNAVDSLKEVTEKSIEK